MNRYTVAVLVRNQFGVLNRVTSMFRRRQFNISSLTVSETESNSFSRITVVFNGEEDYKQQLINQLYKLPDVCAINELTADSFIGRELLLIKMESTPQTDEDIEKAARAYGAVTVDCTDDTVMLQLAASSAKIDDFIDLMRDYKILEICRTGSVSLEKGSATLRQSSER